MDIKDWILIGGGLLLVAVIGHGFWLAWRSRRDTLRMDIDPNIPRDDVDPLDLLRAELPNGGARVRKIEPHEQVPFELEPVMAEATGAAKSGQGQKAPIVPERKSTLQRNAKKPSINTDMLDGDLAWRQHDGGHTDAPNITHFTAWADRRSGRN